MAEPGGILSRSRPAAEASAATMLLERLFLVGLVALGLDLVGAGNKRKKQSLSASRKCAVCDWMVAHLTTMQILPMEDQVQALLLGGCAHNVFPSRSTCQSSYVTMWVSCACTTEHVSVWH